jgi:hypothetical protein
MMITKFFCVSRSAQVVAPELSFILEKIEEPNLGLWFEAMMKFSAPRDDTARAGCGNRGKSKILSIGTTVAVALD